MRLRKKELIHVEAASSVFYSPVSAESLAEDGAGVDWRWFETELGARAES